MPACPAAVNWSNKPVRAFLLALLLLAAGNVFAGRTCVEVSVAPLQAKNAFESAQALQKILDDSGQRLAILVRHGQRLERFGITFSHAAFAVKDQDGWVVYHSLNKCGSAVAALFEQGLADFLADDLVSKMVAIVLPKPELAEKLLKILASKEGLFLMHSTKYSAAAYPFSTKYQNSNGWLLETFALAASDVPLHTREEAQLWLKEAGYEPDVIRVLGLTRLAARMVRGNIEFDDHPGELRWTHRITVNSGDGVLRFVSRYGLDAPHCEHGKFDQAVCIVNVSAAHD